MIKINTTTNVSANIYVGEAFKANKESVLKDFTEFETYVYSLVDTAE